MFVRTKTAGSSVFRGLSGLRGSGLRRGLRRGLGCACGPKQLGQDDGVDAWYNSDVPTAPAPAPVITSNPNPFFLPGQMSAPVYPGTGAPAAASAPTPAISPSAINALLNASGGVNPWFPGQISPVTAGTGILNTTATSLNQSTLNAYLPYVGLGLGAIVLISVLKRR